MKKILARLVVIFVALATCLSIIIPTAGTTISAVFTEPVEIIAVETTEPPTEISTEPTEEETQETEPPDLELLPIEEIAVEVVAGKWGNGEQRHIALLEAGYDANAIQDYINDITPAPQEHEDETLLPEGDYPEATYIWNVLRSWGWSPEACAGIIGNMMAEVGGGTLDLSNWESNGNSGYGLIQWLNDRRVGIKNRYGTYPTIDEQLIYMRDEMFGTNGVSQQVSETQLNKILHSSTPEECAYAFACYFERCGQGHRSIRRSYARTAYEYFMN